MLLIDYQEKWVKDFILIKNKLIEASDGLNIQVEHIGSTAVVGLSAKPIIDIDIIYLNSNDLKIIKNNLDGVGYYHNGDQGIPGREVFKRKENYSHPILDSIKHHLYVCHSDSQELQRHLLFRDHLRQNREARETYEQMKNELAMEAHQDKKVYAALKETSAKEFINTCIENQKRK